MKNKTNISIVPIIPYRLIRSFQSSDDLFEIFVQILNAFSDCTDVNSLLTATDNLRRLNKFSKLMMLHLLEEIGKNLVLVLLINHSKLTLTMFELVKEVIEGNDCSTKAVTCLSVSLIGSLIRLAAVEKFRFRKEAKELTILVATKVSNEEVFFEMIECCAFGDRVMSETAVKCCCVFIEEMKKNKSIESFSIDRALWALAYLTYFRADFRLKAVEQLQNKLIDLYGNQNWEEFKRIHLDQSDQNKLNQIEKPKADEFKIYNKA